MSSPGGANHQLRRAINSLLGAVRLLCLRRIHKLHTVAVLIADLAFASDFGFMLRQWMSALTKLKKRSDSAIFKLFPMKSPGLHGPVHLAREHPFARPGTWRFWLREFSVSKIVFEGEIIGALTALRSVSAVYPPALQTAWRGEVVRIGRRSLGRYWRTDLQD